LKVSTPRVIPTASVGMHRMCFSSPRSASGPLALCVVTGAEARRTPLRWAFPLRESTSFYKVTPDSTRRWRAPDPVDESLARHILSACVNLGQTGRRSPPPEYSQCERRIVGSCPTLATAKDDGSRKQGIHRDRRHQQRYRQEAPQPDGCSTVIGVSGESPPPSQASCSLDRSCGGGVGQPPRESG
jgi:hypothetical protein